MPPESPPPADSGETGIPDTDPPDTAPPDTDPPDTGDPPREDVDGDGWTEVEGDCDDGDAAVNPAATEQAGDGIDQDCDGWVDLDASTVWDADLYWVGLEGTATWSWLGMQGVVPLSDLDGDGGAELAVTTACATHVLHSQRAEAGGVAFVSEATTSILPASLEDPSGEHCPFGLASGVDLGGDGLAELVILQGTGSDGELAFFDGATLAAGGDLSWEEADHRIGLDDLMSMGRNLLWSADYDGDGVEDLVFGEPYATWYPEQTPGRVAVFAGADLALGADLEEEEAAVWIDGDTDLDRWAGIRCLDVGDVDGDGTRDLLVGGYRSSAVLSGATLMASHGQRRLDLALTTIDHGESYWASQAVVPGDLDADGRDDVLLFDESDNIAIDGQFCGGRVDLFLDLGDGGTTTWTEADAHFCDSVGYLTTIAGPVELRPEGQDLLVAGYEGVMLLDLATLPTEGLTDLTGWDDRIDAQETWFHVYSQRNNNLLAADLDGDGDDDVVAGNPYRDADFDMDYDPYETPGILSLFLNPG